MKTFGQAPHSNPTTSAAAAQAILPQVSRLEGVVLQCIRDGGARGACNHEIEARTGLVGNTVRPRVRALVMRGLVRDGGLFRNTESGRRAIAWVAT